MKILLANATAYPTIGGVENSLRYMARELERLGHEVKILCLRMNPSEPLHCRDGATEILRIPYTPARWPHQKLRRIVSTVEAALSEVLREFPADAIWCRSVPVAAGIRRGGFQGPLLQIFSTNAKMHCRGIYLSSRGLPWRRRIMLLALWPFEYFPSRRLEREVARSCVSVAFSECMRTQLLAAFPASAQTCHVIPPGVDHDVFSPENGARYFAGIQQDYGIQPGDPLVLYVGRLSTAKHLPMLMDAFAGLANPATLVLVGGGSDEGRMRAYARNLGIEDRVIFAGSHHDRLPGFYAMSKVSVLPTTVESFGQVYLESLACGTPAVGFAGDGHRVMTATSEIIRDGETGAIVNTPSSEALAGGLDRILGADREQYATMALRAREDAIDRFAWPNFVDRLLGLSAQHGGPALALQGNGGH